ncbi:hypothetical protein ACFSO7_15625 [Bacillus sp. CGMCC 1.16607]|uniref:hypothetical protein n=1 Tax=Bacillus sp. CGMCC 1.16607 TaxID=3351842 RepID=UPI0036447B93
MIIPLPKSFDQNEWFLIISFLISIFPVFVLPKRIPSTIMILMMIYAAVVARLFDHLLAGPPLDFYNLMDKGKFEAFDILTYLLYAPFSYFFVYFYEKWHIKGYKILLYIIASSIGGTAYEWLSHYFNVFNYKEWQLPYSLTVYLLVQPLTLLFYEYIKKAHERSVNFYN